MIRSPTMSLPAAGPVAPMRLTMAEESEAPAEPAAPFEMPKFELPKDLSLPKLPEGFELPKLPKF